MGLYMFWQPLWLWLGLLIVPITLLGILGLLFNRSGSDSPDTPSPRSARDAGSDPEGSGEEIPPQP